MLHVLKELLAGVVPLAVIITAVLGTIMGGLATPTEAAAMGAFGSVCLVAAYRRLTWAAFRTAMLRTLQTSSMVLYLIAAANYFGAVFSILGTPFLITETLLGLGLPPTALLLLLLALIFVLGWPLDWAPIVLIFVPIMIPAIKTLQLDMVWFGTLVAVCLQTAWLTPPMALAAYFLKGVMPEWDLKDI
ncbi:MAG: TRAP transporter large permease subunit, partial [Burkholderiales bacterium]